MELENVKIKVIELEQPIGRFYVGVVKAKDLYDICKTEVRKMERKGDIENYIGIQRPLSKDRVKEIKNYVKTIDASFPNTIILSLNPDNVEIEDNCLFVKRQNDSATIIDGQHRLSGFEDYEPDVFELIVTIFIDLEDEEKAHLFSIINTKQTKINPSLAQDLLEFSKIETPSKVAHNIAKLMNLDKDGPWNGKIKMLGTKSNETEIITQSAFTKEIISRICKKEDLFTIRDELKMNGRQKLSKMYDYDTSKYIFWSFYYRDKDAVIFKILNNYFIAISTVFAEEWGNNIYILSKTTGYKGFMKFFDKAFEIGFADNKLTVDFFKELLIETKSNLKDLTSQEYESGEVGVRRLYNDLMESYQ